MASSMEQNSSKALLTSVGADGSIEIVGTSAVTPPAGYYIQYIVPSSDMAISTFTNEQTNYADLTAIPSHPTGVPIYGRFTSVTLTSGDGIGYLNKI